MEVQTHAPGTFCWIELGTTDQDAARTFYSTLFDWEPNELPMDDGTTYTMLQLGGKDVAALYAMSPEQRQEMPPNWLSYVTVASVDETVKQAHALGGELLTGPFDVFDAGRMAVLRDPMGGAFAVWQANQHIGASRIGEPGSLCWNEFITNDPAAAEAFYTRLFGWRTRKLNVDGPPFYTIFENGERDAGGMYAMNGDGNEVPPHWMVYFAVDDCDARTEKARALGAGVTLEPHDIPGVGRIAVLQDPQGAYFAIIKPNPPA